MRSGDWNRLIAGLLVAPIPFVAHAETYLTEDQAAAVLFPGMKLEPRVMELTSVDMKVVEKASGQKGLTNRIRSWWGPKKEAMVVDRVLGKHEFITYAVAIDPTGKIKGVEILDYHEAYGNQIREATWRSQFVGKSLQDPLRLDRDIRNISGATLSSKHITEGVRRVLKTYEILKQRA